MIIIIFKGNFFFGFQLFFRYKRYLKFNEVCMYMGKLIKKKYLLYCERMVLISNVLKNYNIGFDCLC